METSTAKRRRLNDLCCRNSSGESKGFLASTKLCVQGNCLFAPVLLGTNDNGEATSIFYGKCQNATAGSQRNGLKEKVGICGCFRCVRSWCRVRRLAIPCSRRSQYWTRTDLATELVESRLFLSSSLLRPMTAISPPYHDRR